MIGALRVKCHSHSLNPLQRCWKFHNNPLCFTLCLTLPSITFMINSNHLICSFLSYTRHFSLLRYHTLKLMVIILNSIQPFFWPSKGDFWTIIDHSHLLNTPTTRVCAIYRTPFGCYENLIRSDLFIYSSCRSVMSTVIHKLMDVQKS